MAEHPDNPAARLPQNRGPQRPQESRQAADAGEQQNKQQPGKGTEQRQSPDRALTRLETLSSPRVAGMFPMTPFSLMRLFAEQMDELFDGFNFFGWSSPASMYPPLEVAEREGEVVVRMDLAGVQPQDIKVEIADDVLTIEAERRSESKEEQEGSRRTERTYGRFVRSIPLPPGVQQEEASASFHNGVLELSLRRKSEQERTRQVQVREGPPNRSPAQASNLRH